MIYLDNAATTFPKPEEVYSVLDRFARSGAGNPGRGMHRMSRASEEAIVGARRALASLLGARRPERVIFTLNATDALNMAIKGVLRQGDHAVTSDLEHNSISRPLEGLAAKGVITLTRVRSDGDGRIDPAAVRAAMSPKTRLVALCHASNVLGVVQDASALAEAAHQGGALLLLDGAQSAGMIPIDVEAAGIDLFAVTGHKALLGPMGTGGLILREGVEIEAWREGGTGGDSSSPTQPRELPHRLEGGTPNAVGLAGLAAGVRVVAERGVAEIARHERRMAARLAESLAGSPRVRVVAAPLSEDDGAAGERPRASSAAAASAAGGSERGPSDRRAGSDRANARGTGGASDTRGASSPERRDQTVPIRAALGLIAFTIDGYTPQEAAAILDERFGIAVRAGLHCAPYVHRRHGLFPDGTIRVSAGPFTTAEDIDEAAKAIAEIAQA